MVVVVDNVIIREIDKAQRLVPLLLFGDIHQELP